jgi:hypothetical protein
MRRFKKKKEKWKIYNYTTSLDNQQLSNFQRLWRHAKVEVYQVH